MGRPRTGEEGWTRNPRVAGIAEDGTVQLEMDTTINPEEPEGYESACQGIPNSLWQNEKSRTGKVVNFTNLWTKEEVDLQKLQNTLDNMGFEGAYFPLEVFVTILLEFARAPDEWPRIVDMLNSTNSMSLTVAEIIATVASVSGERKQRIDAEEKLPLKPAIKLVEEEFENRDIFQLRIVQLPNADDMESDENKEKIIKLHTVQNATVKVDADQKTTKQAAMELGPDRRVIRKVVQSLAGVLKNTEGLHTVEATLDEEKNGFAVDKNAAERRFHVTLKDNRPQAEIGDGLKRRKTATIKDNDKDFHDAAQSTEEIKNRKFPDDQTETFDTTKLIGNGNGVISRLSAQADGLMGATNVPGVKESYSYDGMNTENVEMQDAIYGQAGSTSSIGGRQRSFSL